MLRLLNQKIRTFLSTLSFWKPKTRKSNRQRPFGRALFHVTLLLSLVFLRGCFLRPSTHHPGEHFNQGKNAVWLGVEWVHEPQTPAAIASLAEALKERQIAYVFVFTSYLKDHGAFNPTYSYAGQFVQELKEAYPGVKVLAWIGLPLDYVLLHDVPTRQYIVTFSGQLIADFDFDGIHFDPEPIGDGDPRVLALLKETKNLIGEDKILSIASQKAWPVFPNAPWGRLYEPVLWSSDYYREVAHVTDQIAVMTYDSGMGTAALYRQWSRFQVIGISNAVAGTGVELFFGIPTSEENSFVHNIQAENMLSGLSGVINGLNDKAARPEAVTGVAIYPYWETDRQEWDIYHRLWLGN